jgi:hypothetical protein
MTGGLSNDFFQTAVAHAAAPRAAEPRGSEYTAGKCPFEEVNKMNKLGTRAMTALLTLAPIVVIVATAAPRISL